MGVSVRDRVTLRAGGVDFWEGVFDKSRCLPIEPGRRYAPGVVGNQLLGFDFSIWIGDSDLKLCYPLRK